MLRGLLNGFAMKFNPTFVVDSDDMQVMLNGSAPSLETFEITPEGIRCVTLDDEMYDVEHTRSRRPATLSASSGAFRTVRDHGRPERNRLEFTFSKAAQDAYLVYLDKLLELGLIEER